MKMASRSIDVISKQTNCTCSTLFCLSLPLFCETTTLFCTTKTSNFVVTHYFYEGIVVCAYPIFCFLCSCSLLFFTGPYLHPAGRSLLAASISHFLTAALNFHVFFLRNSSLLFINTRSSSFFVIHLRVNIKNNVEEDTTLLLFCLSKSPGGHAISFQIKP